MRDERENISLYEYSMFYGGQLNKGFWLRYGCSELPKVSYLYSIFMTFAKGHARLHKFLPSDLYKFKTNLSKIIQTYSTLSKFIPIYPTGWYSIGSSVPGRQ